MNITYHLSNPYYDFQVYAESDASDDYEQYAYYILSDQPDSTELVEPAGKTTSKKYIDNNQLQNKLEGYFWNYLDKLYLPGVDGRIARKKDLTDTKLVKFLDDIADDFGLKFTSEIGNPLGELLSNHGKYNDEKVLNAYFKFVGKNSRYEDLWIYFKYVYTREGQLSYEIELYFSYNTDYICIFKGKKAHDCMDNFIEILLRIFELWDCVYN
jgi:hypothetical protein